MFVKFYTIYTRKPGDFTWQRYIWKLKYPCSIVSCLWYTTIAYPKQMRPCYFTWYVSIRIPKKKKLSLHILMTSLENCKAVWSATPFVSMLWSGISNIWSGSSDGMMILMSHSILHIKVLGSVDKFHHSLFIWYCSIYSESYMGFHCTIIASDSKSANYFTQNYPVAVRAVYISGLLIPTPI